MNEQFPIENQTNNVEQEPTINDFKIFKQQAEQQARIMGAVDSEGDDFQITEQRVEKLEISPQEGINQIQGILDSRQDYH